LTSTGELWTWGQGNHGELGLGGSTERTGNTGDPQRVKFGTDDEESFVFGITAAGWHSGALVLGDTKRTAARDHETEEELPTTDSAPGNESGEPEERRFIPGSFPGGLGNHPALGGPMFRIGFAGRGARVGLAGRGRGGVGGPRTQPFEPSDDV
jgi:SCF-associated factor 1